MLNKIILLGLLFTAGCVTRDGYLPPIKPSVNETNYMKMPCLIDGSIVKKKPKVINIKDDSNSTQRR